MLVATAVVFLLYIDDVSTAVFLIRTIDHETEGSGRLADYRRTLLSGDSCSRHMLSSSVFVRAYAPHS